MEIYCSLIDPKYKICTRSARYRGRHTAPNKPGDGLRMSPDDRKRRGQNIKESSSKPRPTTNKKRPHPHSCFPLQFVQRVTDWYTLISLSVRRLRRLAPEGAFSVTSSFPFCRTVTVISAGGSSAPVHKTGKRVSAPSPGRKNTLINSGNTFVLHTVLRNLISTTRRVHLPLTTEAQSPTPQCAWLPRYYCTVNCITCL